MKIKNLLFCTCLCGVSVLQSFSQSIPSHIPQQGLVAYFGFDANANDLTGNNNNGTVNGVTPATDRFGVANKAYSFDGINDNIVVGDLSEVLGSYSISLWFTNTEFGNTEAQGLISKCAYAENEGTDATFYIAKSYGSSTWGTTSPALTGGFENSTGNNSNVNFTNVSNLTEWTNVVYSCDIINKQIKLYVNGVLAATTLFTGNPNINTESVVIGNLFPADANVSFINSCYYEGKIDDIGIWNRALTENEVIAVYTDCKLITQQSINSNVNVEEDATFTIETENNQNSIIWQTNTDDLGWLNLPENSTYIGINSHNLTVNNVKVGNHNQSFRAIVSSGYCIDTTDVALLQITNTCISEEVNLITVTDTLIINPALTGVAFPNNNIIKMYPNPASTSVTIDNGDYVAMDGYTIKIVSPTVQTVFEEKIQRAKMEVDITGLAKGIYTVLVLDENSNIAASKSLIIK